MMKKSAVLACALATVALFFASGLPLAQSPKDKPNPWIVDDVNAGFATAKKTGKPLLIVFR